MGSGDLEALLMQNGADVEALIGLQGLCEQAGIAWDELLARSLAALVPVLRSVLAQRKEGETVSDSDKTAQAQRLWVDWQALLAQYGPVVAKIVLDFLSQLAQGKQAGAAKTQCSPECLAELDSAIEELVSGVARVIHHRDSMDSAPAG